MTAEYGRRDVLARGITMSAGAGLLSCTPLAALARAVGAPTEAVVTTLEGRLRGTATARCSIFKGVRYASAGKQRRFRPADPLLPWTGTRDAIALGPQCFQRNIDTSPWVDPTTPDEDCLVLNIWSPTGASKAPVMVWIHGGSFYWGSGGMPVYDGEKLAVSEDVVVVTLNHRLNLFGYLYLGGVAGQYADSANIGQRDLIEALRWIKRNIGSFGGDPNNVTLFGESGGAAKISILAAMPSARGLFSKAIVQSGSQLTLRSADVATDEARAVLRDLGLSESDAGRLGEVPADLLLKGYDKAIARSSKITANGRPFSPVLDDGTVPYQPSEAAAYALWNDVPLLVGNTEQETAYQLGLRGTAPPPMPASDAEVAAQVADTMSGIDSETASALVSTYRARMPHADTLHLFVAVTTGIWMAGRATRQARLKTERSSAPCYKYIFGWQEPFLGQRWSLHGSDVPYVFGTTELAGLYEEQVDTREVRRRYDPSGQNLRLSDAMMAAWANFARNGNPATAKLPHWPDYRSTGRPVMRFDAQSHVIADPTDTEIEKLLFPASKG